jgi:hypothetical protein
MALGRLYDDPAHIQPLHVVYLEDIITRSLLDCKGVFDHGHPRDEDILVNHGLRVYAVQIISYLLLNLLLPLLDHVSSPGDDQIIRLSAVEQQNSSFSIKQCHYLILYQCRTFRYIGRRPQQGNGVSAYLRTIDIVLDCEVLRTA